MSHISIYLQGNLEPEEVHFYLAKNLEKLTGIQVFPDQVDNLDDCQTDFALEVEDRYLNVDWIEEGLSESYEPDAQRRKFVFEKLQCTNPSVFYLESNRSPLLKNEILELEKVLQLRWKCLIDFYRCPYCL